MQNYISNYYTDTRQTIIVEDVASKPLSQYSFVDDEGSPNHSGIKGGSFEEEISPPLLTEQEMLQEAISNKSSLPKLPQELRWRWKT
jgi:hypothetical protein